MSAGGAAAALDLVRLCARLDPSAAAITAVVDSVDWNEVARIAQWHRVEPIVYATLRRLDALPDHPAVRDLQAAHDTEIIHDLGLGQTIDRVCDAFADAAVPVILLKGAALRETCYPRPELRCMGDVDVLVPLEQREAADAAARSMGFRPSEQDDTPEALDHHLRRGKHLPPLHLPSAGTTLEIHWHILKPPFDKALDPRVLWDASIPTTRPGRPHRLLSPEHQLIHLCLNFVCDRLATSRTALRQVTDIAEFGALDGMPWDSFASEVERLGLEEPVALALGAVAHLRPDRAPSEPVVRRLSGGRGNDGMRFAQRRVLRSEPWLAPDLLTRLQPYRAIAAGPRADREPGRGRRNASRRQRFVTAVRSFGRLLGDLEGGLWDLRLNRRVKRALGED